ncbi:MAG: hypothetical protein ICV68_10995 [Pyrinomonadaceae bacterium]|nr:hypothetical protein [Pyrinomonadaceae bacterium]
MTMHIARLLALVLLTTGQAAATTIVAVKTRHEIVIGADSKVTDTFGGATANQACKIVQAGNLFFAYEGMARNRRTGFDIVKLAAQALALKPTASLAEKVSILTGFVTSRLFTELPNIKQNDPATYREKMEGGQTFLTILVAGFEGGEPFLFIRGFRAVPLGRQKIGVSVVPDDCLADCREEIVVKSLGETAAIEGLPEETPGFWTGGVVEGVRRLIETEIAARSEYVGPPIDILRIDKAGAEWIQKKPSCPGIDKRPSSTKQRRRLRSHFKTQATHRLNPLRP